jgi:type IV secretion system protein VirB5
MSGGLVWQSLQSRVTPYVVEVDRLGEARAVAPAERDYRPDDAEIAWHLARFIVQVRSVSLDPVLMRRNWLSAYDFVTKRGSRFLSNYAASAHPFELVGERTVSVEVTTVIRASDRSFQVEWTETAFERGAETGKSRWTAILGVVQRPPASAEVLRRNPLGLYVDAIDWSRQYEAGPAPPAPSPGGSIRPGAARAPGFPATPTPSATAESLP